MTGTHYGYDYWRQASYSDLLLLKSWCVSLSDSCWQQGESGLWCWFGDVCGIEAERRTQRGLEQLCWDLPAMFYANPQRLAAAALDARALLMLCQNDAQRAMVDRLLFDLLTVMATALSERAAEEPAAEPSEKV